MKYMLFISRHAPTEEQLEMARQRGYELLHVGDMDAFAPETLGNLQRRLEFHGAEAVACVHPALALTALNLIHPKDEAASVVVGVFENEARPPVNGKPSFKPKKLHLWQGAALNGLSWDLDVAIYRLWRQCSLARFNASPAFFNHQTVTKSMSTTHTIKPTRLTDYFSEEVSDKLRDLAKRFDAAIIVDGDGDIALLGRIYDNQGNRLVRFAPDPCNFRPTAWWLNATDQQAEKAVC